LCRSPTQWHTPYRQRKRPFRLFDFDDATGHGRAFADVGGPAYLTTTLGVPRTLHVSYMLGY
jgi:hypothetical protein